MGRVRVLAGSPLCNPAEPGQHHTTWLDLGCHYAIGPDFSKERLGGGGKLNVGGGQIKLGWLVGERRKEGRREKEVEKTKQLWGK